MTEALAERSAQLRHRFDQAFAEPATPVTDRFEDLLRIRVANAAYAVRLDALSGLSADRAITPLPGRLPELLGVVAFRGLIVAVYDLGALLGHHAATTPRWLVLD